MENLFIDFKASIERRISRLIEETPQKILGYVKQIEDK